MILCFSSMFSSLAFMAFIHGTIQFLNMIVSVEHFWLLQVCVFVDKDSVVLCDSHQSSERQREQFCFDS